MGARSPRARALDHAHGRNAGWKASATRESYGFGLWSRLCVSTTVIIAAEPYHGVSS
jgi:hypothetical protein